MPLLVIKTEAAMPPASPPRDLIAVEAFIGLHMLRFDVGYADGVFATLVIVIVICTVCGIVH